MNTTAPVVSVIITCYNDEAHVARAIDSVLQQTFKDYEILLVDNNSTDGTLHILNNYKKTYPEIIKVFQESKQGCPAARNKGLYEASGEWIQILDSDDELLPQKFEHDLLLSKDEDVDIIVSNRINYRVINNQINKKLKETDTRNIWHSLLLFRFCSTNSCLWRKKTLLKVNGWNESWRSVEDYEIYYRIFKLGAKLAFSPFADCIVHKRGNSMSNSSNTNTIITHIEYSIKTRLLIFNFMKMNGLLTKELEAEFRDVFYLKLLSWKSKAPDFVRTKIKELNFPIRIKIKNEFNVFRIRVSKKLQKIINYHIISK